MPNHFIKGLTLAGALLAPLIVTLFCHWRITAAARRNDRPQ
jgi:hypothetical protein